jgi:hypothetical protein
MDANSYYLNQYLHERSTMRGLSGNRSARNLLRPRLRTLRASTTPGHLRMYGKPLASFLMRCTSALLRPEKMIRL